MVHPNVLAIHQVHAGGRLPFLVMPLVAGESLAQRLTAQGRLELKEILRIGMQAAAGLAAAHEQGLVHRDVKPANILLEKGVERAVLTDFGLARAADDVSMTRWGIIAGTPQYMSPEQARGEPLDGRSDLFSLGCVLYEMATGVSPFRADSTVATLRRLIDDPPQAMASLNPELPPWFVGIVERLLEKDPSRRFASAKEVSELLEGCLAHLQQPGSVPLPAGVLPAGVPPLGGINPPKGGTPARATKPGRATFWKGMIAMIATLGIGLLGMFLLSATPPDIAGQWTGEDWGQVVLKKTSDGEYTGTYSDTVSKQPGEIQLKWSRIERRFNGTWREGEDRFGELSVRRVGDEIRGALTTDPESKVNPATPRLADLTWIKAVSNPVEVEVQGKPKPTFGPVMERVLPFGDAPCMAHYFQFRSGRVFDVGHGFDTTKEDYEKDMKPVEAAGGADAYAAELEKGFQFIGMGCLFTDEASPNWETLTAEEAVKCLRNAAWIKGVLEPRKKELPQTWLFKTSRGEMGILELLDIVPDERGVHHEGEKGYGVKLRYKLVNNTQPQSSAALPHSATATDPPRQVVAEFLRRLKAAIEKKMDTQMVWDLTTPSSSAGWASDLETLAVEERIHPLHQLGNGSQTLVLSAPFKDDFGCERIFSAILLKRDGRWLIDRHDAYRSRKEVESLLDGFLLNQGVKFDVQTAELAGKWHFPCASTLTLYADGKGVRVNEGPSGVPEKPEHFRWEVSGATLRMHWPDHTDTATVTWVTDDAFRIIDAKGQDEYFDYREEAIAPGSLHEFVVYDPRLTRQQAHCFGIDVGRRTDDGRGLDCEARYR